jgi:DNA polymerase zeta
MTIDVLLKLEVMDRSSEMARLIGVDFYSILTRGSQFRVESVMLRITKPLNYVLIAPSRLNATFKN